MCASVTDPASRSERPGGRAKPACRQVEPSVSKAGPARAIRWKTMIVQGRRRALIQPDQDGRISGDDEQHQRDENGISAGRPAAALGFGALAHPSRLRDQRWLPGAYTVLNSDQDPLSLAFGKSLAGGHGPLTLRIPLLPVDPRPRAAGAGDVGSIHGRRRFQVLVAPRSFPPGPGSEGLF